jgi:hypothetical protein
MHGPRSIAAVLAAAGVAVAAACAKNPQVSVTLFVPDAVSQNAAWIEVGVFAASACPDPKQLMSGIPSGAVVSRLAFKRGNNSPPNVGDLKKGTYAFAAALRAADCSVIGTGCSVVDVTDARDVGIHVAAASNPASACGPGATCDNARCVPGNDNSDPSVGARCSLQLLGAGPLGDPLAYGGTVVSAPAIAATDSGFLVAYREYDGLQGQARLTLLPVDNGGGSAAVQPTTLPSRCPGSEESDATAIAFASGNDGLVAVARAPCGASGGVDLFQVDGAGNVVKSGFNGSGGVKVTLANARALTSKGGQRYLLAFTENDETHVATVNGVVVESGAAPAFGGAPPQSSGWVSASDKVVALLSEGAGVDPGDAGAIEGGVSDGGAPGASSLRVQIVAAGASLASLPSPLQINAAWGSISAQGTRVFVVSDSETPGKPVGWRAFDLGGAAAAASDSFGVDGLGKVLYADVAFHQDHAFFAVEQPGAISLVAYEHATTNPTLLRQVFLPRDPRVPAMLAVRDGHVAIAASDSRVAVVWTTAKTLTDNDVVGGYAVFACTP